LVGVAGVALLTESRSEPALRAEPRAGEPLPASVVEAVTGPEHSGQPPCDEVHGCNPESEPHADTQSCDHADEGHAMHAPGAAPCDEVHGCSPGSAPHGGAPTAAPTALAPKSGEVMPATGPGGYTISQIHAQRTQLSGKSIRVRAVVTKVVTGVMNTNFVRLRDGTGTAKDAELTATMPVVPKLGDTVLLEGTLAVDKDVGAGYFYPALLEGARQLDGTAL
jgi:hypothetical protein